MPANTGLGSSQPHTVDSLLFSVSVCLCVFGCVFEVHWAILAYKCPPHLLLSHSRAPGYCTIPHYKTAWRWANRHIHTRVSTLSHYTVCTKRGRNHLYASKACQNLEPIKSIRNVQFTCSYDWRTNNNVRVYVVQGSRQMPVMVKKKKTTIKGSTWRISRCSFQKELFMCIQNDHTTLSCKLKKIPPEWFNNYFWIILLFLWLDTNTSSNKTRLVNISW